MTPPRDTLLQRHRIPILRVLFLCILPILLFSRSAWEEQELIYEVMEATGALLIIAGVLGRFWSILYSGGRKNQEVVQDGPYSICRHPLYLFSTVAMFGFGILTGSVILTGLIGGATFVVLWLTAKNEEQYLRTQFGTAYDDYSARVPAIIPAPSLFQSPQHVTFDVSHLRKNLRDALVFLSLLPLAEFIEYFHESALLRSFVIW